jgi:hypothetical protein
MSKETITIEEEGIEFIYIENKDRLKKMIFEEGIELNFSLSPTILEIYHRPDPEL